MLVVKDSVQLSIVTESNNHSCSFVDYGVHDCNVNAPLPRKSPICGEKTTVMYDCIFNTSTTRQQSRIEEKNGTS